MQGVQWGYEKSYQNDTYLCRFLEKIKDHRSNSRSYINQIT